MANYSTKNKQETINIIQKSDDTEVHIDTYRDENNNLTAVDIRRWCMSSKTGEMISTSKGIRIYGENIKELYDTLGWLAGEMPK